MKRIIPLIIMLLFNCTVFSQNYFSVSSFEASSQEKTSLSDDIKIYPNPCKQEKITIEFSSKEIVEVRITNIAGKEVLVEKLQIPENKKQIQLNDISNGIYLMRIKTSDDQLIVKKIVIAKD
jgi:hypothetical protein